MGSAVLRLEPGEFAPERLERGAKHRIAITVGSADLPVLVARGAAAGATLVVTACVHGDEYEGTRAILEEFEALNPVAMKGDLIAVTAANPLAFWAGTRTSPLDGGNLARVFPGKEDGTPTEQLAWHLGRAVIARADLYLDLHSAGVRWAMPALVGFDSSDPRGRAAALAFGCEVIWGHPAIAPGRTVSFATERRIPFLYTESRGSGRIGSEELAIYRRGIRNLLRHTGIAEGELERAPLRVELQGDGNIENGVTSPVAGFLVPEVALLDRVRKGDRLGRLYNPWGELLFDCLAPRDGVLVLIREFPVVEAGEPLFLLTDTVLSGGDG